MAKKDRQHPRPTPSESRFYELVFQNAAEGMVLADPGGTIIDANPAYARLMGAPHEELVGKNIVDVVTGACEEGERLLAGFREGGLSDKDLAPRECTLTTEKGSTHVLLVHPVLVREDDDVKGLCLILEDVTRQKLSEQRYKSMFESANDAIVFIDRAGTIIDINPKAIELLGYSREEFVGHHLKDLAAFFPKKSLAVILKNFGLRMMGQQIPPYTVDMRTKAGKQRYVEINAVPLHEAGRIVGDLAVLRDVTHRQRQDRALRESEERFRALAENSQDVIMRFDADLRHLYVNPAVEAVTGMPPKEFFGKTHAELGFPEDLVSLWEEAIRKVFSTGEPNRIEFQLPSDAWIDWLVYPEFSATGDVAAVLTSARDVTKRKTAEKELQKRLEELERFTTLAVGREKRIMELKRRIAELESGKKQEGGEKTR